MSTSLLEPPEEQMDLADSDVFFFDYNRLPLSAEDKVKVASRNATTPRKTGSINYPVPPSKP